MTATSISANRLRMITSQYSAPAVEAAAFDPIAPAGSTISPTISALMPARRR